MKKLASLKCECYMAAAGKCDGEVFIAMHNDMIKVHVIPPNHPPVTPNGIKLDRQDMISLCLPKDPEKFAIKYLELLFQHAHDWCE